jgi:hypothetical protein
MSSLDVIGFGLAALFTIAILSYLIGDNPLYRVAVNLFVGVTAGYAVVVVAYNVLKPWALRLWELEFTNTGWLLSAIAAALGAILVLRAFRIAAPLGSWVMAFLVGVGAAVAIGGAVTGTLFPQMRATFVSLIPSDLEKWVSEVVILFGTLVTLGFFYYGARGERGQKVERPALVRGMAFFGQIFIGTAFGTLYAGALVASLAFFAGSLQTLIDAVASLGF